jgi:hypothetical protein
MQRRRNQQSDISIGTRYHRRDAPNVVWEVLSLYVGVDGHSHAMLSNVADPLWRKTISQIELEQGGEYIRVPTK